MRVAPSDEPSRVPLGARDRQPPPLRIVRLGSFAARFVTRHATARVIARFDRSLYLGACGRDLGHDGIGHDGIGHGDIMCVVAPSIGGGPLNAELDDAGARSLARARIEPGDRVALRGVTTVGRDLVLAAAGARTWSPQVAPGDTSLPIEKPALAASLAALSQLYLSSSHEGRRDGLAPLVFEADPRETPLLRAARPRIARLQAWLIARAHEPHSPPETEAVPRTPAFDRSLVTHEAFDHQILVRGAWSLLGPTTVEAGPATVAIGDLVGMGPGLTPSGDDLLVGALIALRAAGRTLTASDLAANVVPGAERRTILLSRAFLVAAAEGEAGEHLHRAIDTLVTGDQRLLPDAIDAAAGIGHSSGWDALAGAALALRSIA